MDIDGALPDLNQLISDVAEVIEQHTTDLTGLEQQLASQQITSDYLEINEDPIDLGMSTQELGLFTACPGETIEFHMRLTDLPGVDSMDQSIALGNYVFAIQLLDNTD